MLFAPVKMPPKMQMRLATTRDLHRLTEITTTSLIDDPTYDYVCPLRKQFPEDNFWFWQLKLEKYLYDKRCTVLVVEIEPDSSDADAAHGADALLDTKDEGYLSSASPIIAPQDAPTTITSNNDPNTQPPASAPIIISYGIWERLGNNDDACARFAAKNTWLNLLDNTTARLSRWSTSLKYPRRDTRASHVAANAAATATVAATFFSDSPDWWSMELLVTARAWRRRGAASALVRWGVAQADAERVFCGVESSALGAAVYARAGFRWLADWKVQVPGESEVLPFQVMRREPSTAEDDDAVAGERERLVRE